MYDLVNIYYKVNNVHQNLRKITVIPPTNVVINICFIQQILIIAT